MEALRTADETAHAETRASAATASEKEAAADILKLIEARKEELGYKAPRKPACPSCKVEGKRTLRALRSNDEADVSVWICTTCKRRLS